ncbi:hypothetical protein QQS21_004377 [Conoideocrella luteorostrata]|uniref:SnoaL-like domain-containing protein n=1 Tax=Conoideocrella luteorostrata TaxID=1105319 RepID=A0AAJ0CRK8_9HYPO|nr:hypothetical protein QQS21_004377 [Conoideocrella luteorostrata]
MPLPHSLGDLTPREAVADAVYRALSGFDHNDVEIFTSAFAKEDVTMELRDGNNTPPFQGFSAIRTNVFGFVSTLETTHMTSNIRVHIKDSMSASLTAQVSAQHAPAGKGKDGQGPKYLVGAEYEMDLIKDETDGLWKIKKWIVEILWADGDASVMAPPN